MRVLIADDSPLLREGLGAVLKLAGATVVTKARSAAGLYEALDALCYDAVLVGIALPDVASTTQPCVIESIRRVYPGVAVLVLGGRLDVGLAVRLISQRPVSAGYILKEPLPQTATLLRAIRVVHSGGTFVDQAVVERLRRARCAPVRLDRLSKREHEILALMADGRTNCAICHALCLSPKTVETHVRAIYTKLDLRAVPEDHRRVLAAVRYLQSQHNPHEAPAEWATAA